MRDFVFVFLVCRGPGVIFGLRVVVAGGVASGFFSSPGRWGAGPSPLARRGSRLLGQESRGVTQHPWVLGTLRWETLLVLGIGGSVGGAGPGSPVRASALVSTVCRVLCVGWCVREPACLFSTSLGRWKSGWAKWRVKGTVLLSPSRHLWDFVPPSPGSRWLGQDLNAGPTLRFAGTAAAPWAEFERVEGVWRAVLRHVPPCLAR